MCGIAGFIDLWDTKNVRDAGATRPDPREHVRGDSGTAGPDDSGSLLKDGVALGMRRLSIIDLGRWSSTDLRRRWLGDDCLQR